MKSDSEGVHKYLHLKHQGSRPHLRCSLDPRVIQADERWARHNATQEANPGDVLTIYTGVFIMFYALVNSKWTLSHASGSKFDWHYIKQCKEVVSAITEPRSVPHIWLIIAWSTRADTKPFLSQLGRGPWRRALVPEKGEILPQLQEDLKKNPFILLPHFLLISIEMYVKTLTEIQ